MKRKKFFLDPKIVLQKCNNMMKSQISIFEKRWGAFEAGKDNYYTYFDNGDYLSVKYYEDAKFAAKTFNTKITLILEEINMEKHWEASLTFKGTSSISDIVWTPNKREYKDIVHQINCMHAFNSALLHAVKQIDLVTINLSYSRDMQRMVVEILPYAGSYVWVKLPPAHCEIPLKPPEVEIINTIVDIFEQHFTKK